MDQRPPDSGRTPAPGGQPRRLSGGRFRWDERLHRQRDFSHVIRQGRRYSQAGLILWINRDPLVKHPPRLGLAIPGTFGNAVARNRLKRLLREIFRLNKRALSPGTDMVFGARPMTTALTYKTLEPLVRELWKKAGLLDLPLR